MCVLVHAIPAHLCMLVYTVLVQYCFACVHGRPVFNTHTHTHSTRDYHYTPSQYRPYYPPPFPPSHSSLSYPPPLPYYSPLSDISNCHPYPYQAPISHGSLSPCSSDQCYSSPASLEPFFIKLLNGRIKVCAGCKGTHMKDSQNGLLPPPYDICVGHWEPLAFVNPRTGVQSSKMGNAYYHVSLSCIRKKHPEFTPSQVICDEDVRRVLNPVHFKFLWDTLGFDFQWRWTLLFNDRIKLMN